jgi:hypothetical protein
LGKKEKEENLEEKKDGNKVPADNNIEETNDKEIITKAKFEELRFKTELSDDEIKQVVTYANKE